MCVEIFFSGTWCFSGHVGILAAARDVFLDAEACALKTLELMYCRAQVQMRRVSRVWIVSALPVRDTPTLACSKKNSFTPFHLGISYVPLFVLSLMAFVDLHLLPAVDSDAYLRTGNQYREKLGLPCRMHLPISEAGNYRMLIKQETAISLDHS